MFPRIMQQTTAEQTLPKGAPYKRKSRARGATVTFTLPHSTTESEAGRVSRARLHEPTMRNGMLREIRAMAYDGAMTDFEIAEALGITSSTLSKWAKEDAGVREALKIGVEAMNERISRSLAHKALGYNVHSEKIMNIDGRVVRVPIVEHVPPELGAIVWWQKNKAGWSDKNDVSLSGGLTVKHEGGDPRELAMAILMALRAGVEAPMTIEHKEDET